MSENSLLPWIIYFSLAILVQSLKCKPGDYEIDNECCPMCLSGSVVKNHCTSHISTECVPCVPPTYMDHPNGETKCLKCKICDAGAGLIIQKPCTYTSNTVCECQFGYFCPEDSGKECDLCQEHTKCKPGKIIKKIVKNRRAPRYLCPIDDNSSSSGGESDPLPRVFMDREGNDIPVIRRQQRRARPIIENESNEEEELQNPNLEDDAEIQVENYRQDGEANNEEREEVVQDSEIEQVLVQEDDFEDMMQEEEVDRQVHDENSSNDSSDTINYDWVPEDQNILINKKQLLEILKKAEKGLKENYSSLHDMRLKIEKM
ncbi:tumor necrosis factor receptor superfamily member 14 isoform X1 [Bombina bombina]|uniref:tumor necrosis factor receptor superfamily member 14 isoform X1 n=1 Tax=Bombina bombina TaxID=8345 RepID=UPI00235B281E|nr:tumor necrosis factor receptor superfamily member 14 isoform X1 [Bombina bombina]